MSPPADFNSQSRVVVCRGVCEVCLHIRNSPVVTGRVLRLGRRKPLRPTYRVDVTAAIHRLMECTGEEVFTVTRVFTEISVRRHLTDWGVQDRAAVEGVRLPRRERP